MAKWLWTRSPILLSMKIFLRTISKVPPNAGEFDLGLETIEEELDESFDDVCSSEIGRSPEAVRAESRQILVTHPVQFVPRYPFQRKKMPVEQLGDTILEK